MKTLLRVLPVGALLALLGVGAAWAAAPHDPVVGTWTLNSAKSKFTPGPAPKSLTRTYAASADGTTLTIAGVAADGSPISMHTTFKYDGKDYPYSGSPNYDTLSLKRVNATTVKSVLKKDGKVIGQTTRTLSGHGKVMTLSSKGTNAKGVPFNDVTVFDRQ